MSDEPTSHSSEKELSREERMVVLRRGPDGTPTVWCDPEIADLVSALNHGGVPTIASCSGHGERHGTIALADGRWLTITVGHPDDQERAPHPRQQEAGDLAASLRAESDQERPCADCGGDEKVDGDQCPNCDMPGGTSTTSTADRALRDRCDELADRWDEDWKHAAPGQAYGAAECARQLREAMDGELHFPWDRTVGGWLCACGEEMTADEVCPKVGQSLRQEADDLAASVDDLMAANDALADQVRIAEAEVARLNQVCEDWGKNYQSWVDGKAEALSERDKAWRAHLASCDPWKEPCGFCGRRAPQSVPEPDSSTVLPMGPCAECGGDYDECCSSWVETAPKGSRGCCESCTSTGGCTHQTMPPTCTCEAVTLRTTHDAKTILTDAECDLLDSFVGVAARERLRVVVESILAARLSKEGTVQHGLVMLLCLPAQCTCGWKPTPGENVVRGFDKHLAGIGGGDDA